MNAADLMKVGLNRICLDEPMLARKTVIRVGYKVPRRILFRHRLRSVRVVGWVAVGRIETNVRGGQFLRYYVALL